MHWFQEQLHRLSWAYNHEAASFVQGVSALVTTISTVVLIWITGRSMRLTRETLNVTRGQVAALFQPSLEFELNAWVDDKEVLVIGGHCTNVGDHSIRITLIQLQRCGEAVNMKIPKDLILNPKQKYDTGHVHTHLPIPEKRRPGDFVRDVVMVVECSDLAGVGRHQFAYSPASGLRHERIDG